MKNIYLLLFLSFTMSGIHASHFAGGEVTWRCISENNREILNEELNASFTAADNGKFVFVAKYYGNCSGPTNLFIPPAASSHFTLNSRAIFNALTRQVLMNRYANKRREVECQGSPNFLLLSQLMGTDGLFYMDFIL